MIAIQRVGGQKELLYVTFLGSRGGLVGQGGRDVPNHQPDSDTLNPEPSFGDLPLKQTIWSWCNGANIPNIGICNVLGLPPVSVSQLSMSSVGHTLIFIQPKIKSNQARDRRLLIQKSEQTNSHCNYNEATACAFSNLDLSSIATTQKKNNMQQGHFIPIQPLANKQGTYTVT